MAHRPTHTPVPALGPESLADLRRRAAVRLTGTATTRSSAARAADALSVLHTLASSPDTAADALTLLHELQVHQIELEMQAQELHESRAELEDALRRQIVLYNHQPAGSFTIDERLVLHELNQTGAAMLGLARDEAYGVPLDTFFCADSAREFRAALARLDAGPDAGKMTCSCLLELCTRCGPGRRVVASIAADPTTRGYLMCFSWPCA